MFLIKPGKCSFGLPDQALFVVSGKKNSSKSAFQRVAINMNSQAREKAFAKITTNGLVCI